MKIIIRDITCKGRNLWRWVRRTRECWIGLTAPPQNASGDNCISSSVSQAENGALTQRVVIDHQAAEVTVTRQDNPVRREEQQEEL